MAKFDRSFEQRLVEVGDEDIIRSPVMTTAKSTPAFVMGSYRYHQGERPRLPFAHSSPQRRHLCDRLAVLARVGGAVIDAGGVAHHRLAGADGLGEIADHLQPVAELAEAG